MTSDAIRGARLATARQAAGLRRADVAARLGVIEEMVRRWERGIVRIPYRRWEQLAALLGLPADAWIVPVAVSGRALT